MLAGYLPFDDDPANPEGDNINLLYKYIVSTPLTFPEYVTPHARDLLRRILVPNPRKRADLFEVARHSWLSEYAHLVEFITSSTTLPSDVPNSSSPEEFVEPPMVTRSASVRDNAKQKASTSAAVGGLAKATGKIDPEAEQAQRTPKDAKRRTVQVEYVAPTTQTQRGGEVVANRQQRARSSSRGPEAARDKPLPLDPPVSRDGRERTKPPSAHRNTPTRPTGSSRAFSDDQHAINTGTRPQTGGSMSSAASIGLQNMGYVQGHPLPPTMADTNAQGRIQQPANAEEETMGRPSVGVPPKFARMSGFDNTGGPRPSAEIKGHKRNRTLGEIGSKLLGRSTSKRYPPVSYPSNMTAGEEPAGRESMDSRQSRRSFSLGISKKPSGSVAGSQVSTEKQKRRFSLLPPSFSLKSIGLGREQQGSPSSELDSQPHLPIQDNRAQRGYSSHGETWSQNAGNPAPAARHQRFASGQLDRRPNAIPPHLQTQGQGQQHLNTSSDSSVDMRRPQMHQQQLSNSQPVFANYEGHEEPRVGTSRSNKGVLQKNKRFTSYEEGGAARRVMDFFRLRGKARGGDDRL